MRSDTRALLKILAASFALVAVLFAALIGGVLGGLPKETLAAVAAALLLVGALAIGLVFGPGLTGRDRKRPAPDADD
jgi:predicted benzoate:H+ symporter BenE